MHFGNLVVIPADEKLGTIEERIQKAMGPHEENGGFWDWYQIGGRWTGTLDNYDPEKDPANIEVCSTCQGTGVRKDMVVQNGCNACNGKGIKSVWPTQFKNHPGDMMPVDNLTDEHMSKFYRIIYPDKDGRKKYHIIEENHSNLKNVVNCIWLKENFKGYLAVVVDNHS